MIVKLRAWAPVTASGAALICAMILAGWWFARMPHPGIREIPPPPENAAKSSILGQEAPAPVVNVAAPSGPRLDVARILPSGDVVVAGRSEPGAKVALLDNSEVLLETRADPATGEFVLLPPRLGEGAHQLSVRSGGSSDGAQPKEIAVQSFSISPRGNAAIAGNPPSSGASGGQAEPHAARLDASSGKATITRGDTLWRISRAKLGRGALYKRIYQANSTKIRDPNLIYPEQILTIP